MRKAAADYKCRSIYTLELAKLTDMGYKYLFLDLDNTLAPYDCMLPPQKAFDLIERIHKAGMDVILISNNTKKRTAPFADRLGLPYIYSAHKPFGHKLRKFIQTHSLPAKNSLVIGDQVINDMVLAHKSGLKGLLTEPLTKKDHITAALMRPIDRKLRASYLAQGRLGVDLEEYPKEEI